MLLDVQQVAAQLNVPESWVYDHRDDLPHIKLGRHLRFDSDAIAQWLRDQSS